MRKNSIDLASLILRIVFGGLMLFNHGWGKALKLFGDEPIKFYDFIGLGPQISLGLAVFAELVCAFLVVIGLKTKFSVIPLIVTMLVAIFLIHISDPFARMESAIIYLGAFVSIFLLGSGKYSLDEVLGD